MLFIVRWYNYGQFHIEIGMKVAILSRYYGQSQRGAETFAEQMRVNLPAFGFKVNIYPTTTDISESVDIILSTNGRTDVVQAKLKTIISPSKLVVSGQSGIGWDDRLNLYTFPDAFVALTDFQKKWAKSVNPFTSVEKIPNGVDVGRFNPQAKPIKLDLPKPIILCVGAVSPSKSGEISKRQHLLKQAAKQIGVSVVLVGKGGDMEVNHSQMPGVYTACDLFSYPTEPSESFGISMLEAMACGLPVVATDDPIRREIVGEAGLFVDPQNIDAYAQSLKKALATNWKDKPQKQAAKFSWDKVCSQYAQLFTRLLS